MCLLIHFPSSATLTLLHKVKKDFFPTLSVAFSVPPCSFKLYGVQVRAVDSLQGTDWYNLSGDEESLHMGPLACPTSSGHGAAWDGDGKHWCLWWRNTIRPALWRQTQCTLPPEGCYLPGCKRTLGGQCWCRGTALAQGFHNFCYETLVG